MICQAVERARSHKIFSWWLFLFTLASGGCASLDPGELTSCVKYTWRFQRPIPDDPALRFLGKVREETARCRGGEDAVALRRLPWVDWQNYWATGDATSRSYGPAGGIGHLLPNGRGIDGALLDLTYQRLEMIKFNLFDNSGTYEKYMRLLGDPAGVFHDPYDEMRVPEKTPLSGTAANPEYARLTAHGLTVHADGTQECHGELIRFRDRNGYCNDVFNPLMGSTNQPLARNVQFEAATFLDLDDQKISRETRNRHDHRLSLYKPNPQLISRKLFTRDQSTSENCHEGRGSATEPSTCHYEKATWFNVLAAFWIQFMTHDWFSHLDEGRNSSTMMGMGCTEELAKTIHCRPGDQTGQALVHTEDPGTFRIGDKEHLKKAHKTTLNRVTAWWDASQIYGYDETSTLRAKKDPADAARLLMRQVGEQPQESRKQEGWKQGYLPVLDQSDRGHMNPAWEGQEATAFPDNWSIGLSFFHNLFAREHNKFVEVFHQQDPEKDSGLRRPEHPDAPVPYKDVTPRELFEIARLVVSAEIAKIHTIEWTTQLLYDEPLDKGMNAQWSGLFESFPAVASAMSNSMKDLKKSGDVAEANLKYSAYAAGPGIFGLGNAIHSCWHVFFCPDKWNFTDLNDINGGTHHFGSPFNFPEEFISVYRLHPMLPDLLEYRDMSQPDRIVQTMPVVDSFRKKATGVMEHTGLANWALSMGRQRLGALTLMNHPQFLQNLPIDANGGRIDVAALDIIRDRERGIPRFNEFRRQYGLRTLTSFDDFIDHSLEESAKHDPAKQRELDRQRDMVARLREVYGSHVCHKFKLVDGKQEPNRITDAQVNEDGTPIDDCLGAADGATIDNIEDLDTIVGWLAEPVRPHGFAISETQFQVFILNASRRLFSDRFFTSSFRPEFYSHLGVEWVMNNGPAGRCVERSWLLFEKVDPSPLKCILRRTIPELEQELEHVVNAFDPWARDRGRYYDLRWKAREGAASDDAFVEATNTSARENRK
ncbi:Animal heme peroxidase [Nitrospira japonica]|uniref:Animal heme peroxidase n=1 Tax=Nitrospira japonica TaxID=1325564 RepID=A0A1W1I1E8_9BACT|nr:peroxidase family protein [Nitrospira japonica]SLM46825.1 Animal heme peroxidase [Nitrospira japonica]